jgi:hypothetical protein
VVVGAEKSNEFLPHAPHWSSCSRSYRSSPILHSSTASSFHRNIPLPVVSSRSAVSFPSPSCFPSYWPLSAAYLSSSDFSSHRSYPIRSSTCRRNIILSPNQTGFSSTPLSKQNEGSNRSGRGGACEGWKDVWKEECLLRRRRGRCETKMGLCSFKSPIVCPFSRSIGRESSAAIEKAERRYNNTHKLDTEPSPRPHLTSPSYPSPASSPPSKARERG